MGFRSASNRPKLQCDDAQQFRHTCKFTRKCGFEFLVKWCGGFCFYNRIDRSYTPCTGVTLPGLNLCPHASLLIYPNLESTTPVWTGETARLNGNSKTLLPEAEYTDHSLQNYLNCSLCHVPLSGHCWEIISNYEDGLPILETAQSFFLPRFPLFHCHLDHKQFWIKDVFICGINSLMDCLVAGGFVFP